MFSNYTFLTCVSILNDILSDEGLACCQCKVLVYGLLVPDEQFLHLFEINKKKCLFINLVPFLLYAYGGVESI